LAKEAKDKSYEDYNWDELCKQECKLKDLHVPELNKCLKRHRLTEYIKSGKSDKLRVIINHHRTNGNAESYATEQYQTSAGRVTVMMMLTMLLMITTMMLMKMITLMPVLILMLCTKMSCFLTLEMKKLKIWCGQQLQDREEALQEDPR
jgi:hypothetical protein